jgi:hypothetical protein
LVASAIALATAAIGGTDRYLADASGAERMARFGTSTRSLSRRETEVRFAADSPLERQGFEPSVPRARNYAAGPLESEKGKLSGHLPKRLSKYRKY